MKEYDPRIIQMNIAHFEALLLLKRESTNRSVIEGLLLEAQGDLARIAAAARPA
jgi:hypothetical protein